MEELVNVCLEPFISTVQCTSVYCDGYPVSNLVATDMSAHSKGFRVEHFIRPPVSVLFEFKWPIHVACIIVKPCLENGSEIKLCLDGCHTSNIEANNQFYNLHYGAVARGNQALLQFKNNLKRKWNKKIDLSSDVVAVGSQVRADQLTHTSEQPLRHTNIASRLKHLRLTATYLSGVKPLAISWIEIWGTISEACNGREVAEYRAAVQGIKLSIHSSQAVQSNLFPNHNPYQCTDQTHLPGGPSSGQHPPLGQEVLSRPHPPLGQEVVSELDSPSAKRRRTEGALTDMASSSPSNVPKTGIIITNNPHSTNNTKDGNLSSECNSFLGVPTKYLDALTYDVMLLPMLLPSGHYVDRSTLDKLASNDALYGRPPTDPFTGVPFSTQSKAQFCPRTKLEIDQFLTRRDQPSNSVPSNGGGDSSGGEGRTLGEASHISQHLSRNNHISWYPNERVHPVLESMASNESVSLGGPLLQSTSTNHQGSGDNPIQHVREERKRKLRTVRGVRNEPSFEDKISDSLDVALEQLFKS